LKCDSIIVSYKFQKDLDDVLIKYHEPILSELNDIDNPLYNKSEHGLLAYISSHYKGYHSGLFSCFVRETRLDYYIKDFFLKVLKFPDDEIVFGHPDSNSSFKKHKTIMIQDVPSFSA
jgi:hypothetical protein